MDGPSCATGATRRPVPRRRYRDWRVRSPVAVPVRRRAPWRGLLVGRRSQCPRGSSDTSSRATRSTPARVRRRCRTCDPSHRRSGRQGAIRARHGRGRSGSDHSPGDGRSRGNGLTARDSSSSGPIREPWSRCCSPVRTRGALPRVGRRNRHRTRRRSSGTARRRDRGQRWRQSRRRP